MSRHKTRFRLRAPRTLRGRLVTGLVALLAIACATVGIVTYLAVHRALASGLDNDLQTATGLAYNCWDHQDSGKDGSGQQGNDDTVQGASGNWRGVRPAASPSASAAASPGGTASAALPAGFGDCTGLNEYTFVAVDSQGHWTCDFIGGAPCALSDDDKAALLSIKPAVTKAGDDKPVPTTTRYLSQAEGVYELTAIQDPDGDNSVYYTGMPLSSLHDMLRDVALSETAVFTIVLLLTGILGFLWVRFSLRPLRRVALTASQVAELPLESGEVSLPAGVPDTDPATETGQVGLAFNRMLGHVQIALAGVGGADHHPDQPHVAAHRGGHEVEAGRLDIAGLDAVGAGIGLQQMVMVEDGSSMEHE